MSPEQTHVAHMILQCPLLLDSYHSKTITILACSSGSSSTTLHLQLLSSYWYSSTNPSQCSVHFTTCPPYTWQCLPVTFPNHCRGVPAACNHTSRLWLYLGLLSW